MNRSNIIFLILIYYISYILSEFEQEYNLEYDYNISYKQHKQFIIDSWKVEHSQQNPSITRDPDDIEKFIYVWREPDRAKRDRAGYVWLNSTFHVVKKPDVIETLDDDGRRANLIAEDARIFQANGELLVIYNTHLTKYKQVHFAKLYYNVELDMFYTTYPPNHVSIEHEAGHRHQKNWTPFEYCYECIYNNGTVSKLYVEHLRQMKGNNSYYPSKILYIYSIIPHRIIHTIETNLSYEHTAHTVSLTALLPKYYWQWGDMRGGSPALLINDTHYLTFFHSSGRFRHKIIISYYMGAYLFLNKPPFPITHMTSEPITANSMINESYGWSYKVIDYIVFPMGFVFDDNYIYVSYGKNDRDGWIVQLNKSAFLSTLSPVESMTIGDSLWDDQGFPIPNTYSKIFNNSNDHDKIY